MPIQGLPFTDAELFQLINIVLPGWILLVLLPKWKGTTAYCTLAAFLLSVLYALLLHNKMSSSGGMDLKEMFTLDVRGVTFLILLM